MKTFKTFDVTTAGSGAATTLVSSFVGFGNYEVDVEMFVPSDGTTAFPSELLTLTLSNGTVVVNPFLNYVSGLTAAANYFQAKNSIGPSESSGGSGWVSVFVKLPTAIVQLPQDGTISLVFTDYIYGGPVEVKGLIKISPINQSL